MRRALAIATLVAIVLALLPVLGTVPGTVAHAATIPVVCDGVQDATQTIQPAINSAVDGDVISISAPNGFCDIDFPVQVTHAVTLTSATAPTKVAFKGPEVTAVSSLLASAQASATARMTDAKAKVTQLKSSTGASATGSTGASTPGARSSGQGNGTGGGAGVRGARKAANAAATAGAGASTPQSAHDVAQRIWNSTMARLQGGVTASISTTTGPGIAVYPNLAPVTIQYLTITGFNNTGNDDAGGAIIVGSNTRVTIQNNEIRLNAAARGGGIALIENNDGSLIKNNVIQNNLASCTTACSEGGSAGNAGGAIFAFSDVDNLEISNNYLDDNVASHAGGAVLIGWDADDLKFLANSCVANLAGAKGGCLHIVGSGFERAAGGDSVSSRVTVRDVAIFPGLGQSDRAQFNGNQFLQNQSNRNGGAVNIGAGNGGPTFTNNRFEGNFAGGGEPGGGGAVNIQEQARQVTFTQNQLIGNSAVGQGGAIRLAWQSSTCGTASSLTGNTLSGNAAAADGGAIHFGADADCTRLTGNTYSGNSAGTAGGAVSFGRKKGGGDSVDVVIDSDQYLGNASGGNPFGISFRGFGGGGAIHFGTEMHNLQIRNNTKFQGNTAVNNGGALDFECNPETCGSPSSGNVTISNAQFTNNATTGQFLFDPFCGTSCGAAITGLGGAIFFGGEVSDLLIENVSFTENRTAFGPGGAVAFGEPFEVSESASSLAAKLAQNNKKPSGVSASQLCCSDNVVLRNTQFLRNAATNSGGGAVFVEHQISQFTIDTGLFDSNKASGFSGEFGLYWGGGAVLFAAYADQPTITKSQFINNSANAEGGALYFAADSDGLRVTGQTLFRGNSSSDNGGAIALGGNAGPPACIRGARIDGATFDGNKSNNNGGAISLRSSCSDNLEIDHSTFTRDTANGIGGALILTNADIDRSGVGSSNVRVHHTTFANNSSSRMCCIAAGGGGVAVIGASPGLRFYDNVLHHNTANQPGGNMAVYCTSCDTATLGTAADMQLYNNTFAHGTSASYGGVFIHTDASTYNPTTDPVAFWNNIAYLNLSGDFGSDSTPIVAWNSLIGAAVAPAVCSSVNACFPLDPLFVNAKASDYHLQGSSPAINLGALSNPSVGSPQSAPADDRDNVLRVSPPDAGAYENPGGSPVTATPTGTILTATITDTPTTTQSPTPGSPTATPTPCVPSKQQPLLCATPTISGTATNTPTPSTPTLGPAETLTPTPTITLAAGTPAPSGTPTITNTPAPGTPTATSTPSPTPTSTFTLTPTNTATVTLTRTPTLTRTVTSTPTTGPCPASSPKCPTPTLTG